MKTNPWKKPILVKLLNMVTKETVESGGHYVLTYVYTMFHVIFLTFQNEYLFA